jgi:hypothetical protein
VIVRKLSKEQIAEVEKVLAENKGQLPTEVLVAAATKKRSPLHELFQWDDAACGITHRIEQARDIIASVRYEVTIRQRLLRVPVYVESVRKVEPSSYSRTQDVATDRAEARETALRELQRAIGILERTAGILSELGFGDSLLDLVETCERTRVSLTASESESA